MLTDGRQETIKELHLSIPVEISECGSPAQALPWPSHNPARPLTRLIFPPPARKKLDQVANAVCRKMDQLYQGKMYIPGKGLPIALGHFRPSTI